MLYASLYIRPLKKEINKNTNVFVAEIIAKAFKKVGYYCRIHFIQTCWETFLFWINEEQLCLFSIKSRDKPMVWTNEGQISEVLLYCNKN